MSWTINIPEPITAPATGRTFVQDRSGLAELSEVYRQLGFDAGYNQAARDTLELSVATAEQILGEQGNSLTNLKEARRLLYAFIARVDQRLSLFANSTTIERKESCIEGCNEGYMEGGMGI